MKSVKEYSEKLSKDVKVVVVNLSAKPKVVFPEDSSIMIINGFSTSVPDVIKAFVMGKI